VVTLRGDFAREHKEEMINRIISIEEDAREVVINTTDIHLPRPQWRGGQAGFPR